MSPFVRLGNHIPFQRLIWGAGGHSPSQLFVKYWINGLDPVPRNRFATSARVSMRAPCRSVAGFGSVGRPWFPWCLGRDSNPHGVAPNGF